MRTNRRRFVRIVSFLSAVVFTLAVWGTVNAYKLSEAKKSILASNERALTELGTYLDDINLNLQKSSYSASSKMRSDISTDLWRSSSSAKACLSEITDSNTEISDVYKFLSQVGEYTLTLDDGKTSKKDAENLNKLLEYSEALSERVNYLIEQEENGLLNFEEIKSTLQSGESESVYLGDELNDANQSLNDYPTLIYDGPFSDHIQNKTSAVTEKLEAVSEAQARLNAAEFLGVDNTGLQLLSKNQGNLSTYTFYNNDYTVSVTQKGGLVSYMLTSGYASEIKLNTDQAIKLATQYLNDHGYGKVKESYYSTNDGICTINFAYYDNGITYYSDLIKVSVALDTGKITAFDATGYLMNHTARKIPKEVKYSPIEGKKLINENLEIISYKKAVIPTDWETEDYVYEYHCKAKDGQEVLVYIDPLTGQEKDILILLYTDGGVLTK